MYGMEQIVHAGMIVSKVAGHGQAQNVSTHNLLLNPGRFGVQELQDAVGQVKSVSVLPY